MTNSHPIVNIGCLSVSEDDVLLGISTLNNSKSTDVDGICPFFLRTFAESVVKPLTFIFNRSLSSGWFLNEWKYTEVTPLFKKGDKSNIRNYRPISKLSNVSKLFEHVVMVKLSFLTKSIICDNQHGFVKCRSAVTNLQTFVNYCHQSLEAKLQVHAIYTDFAKAFDRVSHSILIQKLEALGFHSSCLKWIHSYLTNRSCVVVIDNVRSDPFMATSGVPQGSILGPLLFTIFINDIVTCFKYVKSLLFADDLKLFLAVKTSLDCEHLQTDLNALSSWCACNNLSLNISKCFSMVYSKDSSSDSPVYFINNCALSSVDRISDLGVIFDPALSFDLHVNYIVPKAMSTLAFIRRHNQNFSDPYTLKILYIALVRSRLEYATFIWNPYHVGTVSRLERVQRSFTRFALRTLFQENMPCSSARNLLLGIDSLESRRSFLSLLFVRDIISGDINCAELLKRINFNVPSRQFRHSINFRMPVCKTLFSQNEPINRTLNTYNDLLSKFNLDFCVTKLKFKSDLINALRTK